MSALFVNVDRERLNHAVEQRAATGVGRPLVDNDFPTYESTHALDQRETGRVGIPAYANNASTHGWGLKAPTTRAASAARAVDAVLLGNAMLGLLPWLAAGFVAGVVVTLVVVHELEIWRRANARGAINLTGFRGVNVVQGAPVHRPVPEPGGLPAATATSEPRRERGGSTS